MKTLLTILILSLAIAINASAAPKIMNSDVATNANIVDTKILVTGGNINDTLYNAVTQGKLGGGVEFGDELLHLGAVANQTYKPRVPNEFWDHFLTVKGTNTCTVAGSTMRVPAGQTSCYQERERQQTSTATKYSGVANIAPQALAPNNTAIAANTIYFQGSVCEFFPTNKTIVEFIQSQSEGEANHKYLQDATGNVATSITASACSYNAGTDVSSLGVNNSGALDLTMGVSAGNQNTSLRFAPLDIQFQAKGSSGGSYETMPIYDAQTTGTVAIPGENFFTKQLSLTGSVLKADVSVSPNNQYHIARVLENTATASTWHFGYSINYGKTWVDLGTKSLNRIVGNEFAGNFYEEHQGQLIVANNGKALWTYEYRNTGYGTEQLNAVYSDLSVVTPALTDIVTNGNGTGIILLAAGYTTFGQVSGDTTDLSYVAIFARRSDNGTQYLYSYTNGGATFLNNASITAADYSIPMALMATGTGTSHRTFVMGRAEVNGTRISYVDQSAPSTTVDGTIHGDTSMQPATIGYANNSTKAYHAYAGNSTWYWQYNTISSLSTPSYAMNRLLTSIPVDLYNGWTSSDQSHLFKTIKNRVVIDPNDSNHVFMIADLAHPDGIRRSTLAEISDDSNFLGVQNSNYAAADATDFRYNTARSYIGQTFTTVSTTRLKTLATKLYQVGSIPSGYTITAEIQATTGNIPNGTVIATALNTYDPSKISKSASGQYLMFNFASTSLTASTKYAYVLKSSFPVSTTNYIAVPVGNPGGMAGGSMVAYDGATWSEAGGGAYDMWFELNGEWITDISQPQSATDQYLALQYQVSPFGVHLSTMESQIGLIDSNTIQSVLRRIPQIADANEPVVGHTFRRVISINSGAKATITDAKIAGYAVSNYDPNLVANISLGNPASAQLNVITGAPDNAHLEEDRSGFGLPYYSLANVTFTTESGFNSGYTGVFNGSNSVITYSSSSANEMNPAISTVMEAEIKLVNNSGQHGIAAKCANNTTAPGWIWWVNSSGYLSFYTFDGSTYKQIIASDKAEPLTAHKVRFVWDAVGQQGHLYRSETAPFTTFTEVGSYSSQQVIQTTSTSYLLSIGDYGNGSLYAFNGEIGYFRMAKGTTSFAYNDWKSQPTLYGPQIVGTKIMAEQETGTMSTTNGTWFNNFGIIQGDASQASVVDSYLDTFMYKASFGVPGSDIWLKELMGKGSDRNASYMDAYDIRFAR